MSIKYFIYARKSREAEDKQVASIEDQVSEVKRLASSKGLEIAGIIEESKSAKAPGRPLFNKMLKRIKSGEAQGILCWKLNRLARNPVDGGEISWLLQQGIIQHIQTYERDYKPTDNVLMMQVEFGMANQYIKDLSTDVKRGHRHKAQRGWYPCQHLPLGYAHNPERIKLGVVEEIKIDAHIFTKLTKLWKLMLTGHYSIPDIQDEAAKLNLRNKDGNLYSRNTYHRIFTNEFYSGYFHWPNDEGVRVRHFGKHPTMVTPAEFEKVQWLLGNRSRDTRNRTYYFPYRGLISCGECSGHVTAEHKLQVICTACKTKFSIKTKSTCPKCGIDVSEMQKPSTIDQVYYRCTKNRGVCSQGCATADSVHTVITNTIKRVAINKEFLHWAIRALTKLNENNTQDAKARKQLRKRETELKNRVDGLITMRASGEISQQQFGDLKIKTETDLKKVHRELYQHERLTKNWLSSVKEELQFLRTGQNAFRKADDRHKHRIVQKLASNLAINEKKLCITTRRVLRYIRNLSDTYCTNKACFEPENILDKLGSNSRLDPQLSTLRGQLNAIRTEAIKEVLKREEENGST